MVTWCTYVADLKVGIVEGPEALLGKSNDGRPLPVVEGCLQLQINAPFESRPNPGHLDGFGGASGRGSLGQDGSLGGARKCPWAGCLRLLCNWPGAVCWRLIHTGGCGGASSLTAVTVSSGVTSI